jgi:hypothetical protein
MFSCVWNLCALDEPPPLGAPRPRASGRAALAAGLAVLALWAVEARTTARIISGRSDTFRSLAGADWRGYADRQAVAADIGMFGYFSRTRVCDLAGLVNGRRLAQATTQERAAECARQRPAVAFLTDDQVAILAPHLDVRGWTPCREVSFTNVRSLDLHRLYVDPRAGLACP